MKRSETRSVEPSSVDPAESPHSNATNLSPVGEMRLQLNGESNEADLDVAKRHVLQTSCTIYDPVSDSYKWRSIKTTTRQDMGDYGLGVHLYFDFMNVMSILMITMAVICTPLLVVNYCGDFAGVAASFFAKLTIGNIGYCGVYGELCPSADSYQYRVMLSNNSDVLLRDITPYFGAASCAAIGIFGIVSLYYYYIRLPRIAHEYNVKHITPTDFSIEIDFLPRVLPEGNAEYENLLRRHFECIVGKENCVAEVALAREYCGAIRTFLRIGELDIEIREMKARLKAASSERTANSLRNHVYHLEKLKEKCEKRVEEQALIAEVSRPVVKAFIIFSETRYQQRVLETYKWSRQGPLMRLLQSRALQFMNHSIYVRAACEPGNVYQENLDVSKREVFIRKCFTVAASVGVLIFTAMLLIVAQTATRASGPVGVGEKPVWIVANATSTNGTCFGPCGVSLFSDSQCTVSLQGNISGLVGSSGVYVPGIPVIVSTDLGSTSTCSSTRNWASDRCTAISGGNDVFDSGKENLFNRRLEEISDLHNPIAFVTSQVVLSSNHSADSSITMRAVPHALPATSSCGSNTQCSNGSGPDLNMCYSPGEVCDKIWDCPLGDDESGCSYLCESTEWKCPQSAKCIDQMFGSCGSECVADFTSVACVGIASRTVPTACDSDAVDSILSSTFGNVCVGGFYADPCCTLTHIDETEREILNCIDDGEIKLGWMSSYCDAARRETSTVCSANLVSRLVAISPSCQSAVVHNRYWCECLEEASLIALADKDSLETCHVESTEWLYLGSQTKPNGKSSVMDTLRFSCENSLYFRNAKHAHENSPLVVLGYTYVTALSSVDIAASVSGAIGTSSANVVVYGVQVGSNTGVVRIEVSDRSNTTAGWTVTVGTAAASIDSSVSSALGVAGRTVQKFEPHCDSESFQCPVTRNCIAPSQLCDGVPDCSIPLLNSVVTADESEIVCPNLSLHMPNVTTNLCLENQFLCDSGTQCIPDLFWCDGHSDCLDGSDETNSECLVQIEARNATNSISSLTIVWQTPEYLAFSFEAPVNVQCIKVDQPANNFASSIIVYACDDGVVFREGFGTVLRSPELSCTKLQTSVVDTTPASSAPVPLEQYTPLPALQVDCTSSECPLLTGNAGSVCVDSYCSVLQNGTISSLAVMQTPQCDYGSPISPMVAKSVWRSYTDDSLLLSDVTYTCFCDQQLQYNYVSDPFFIFPPYDSEIKQTCEVYYANLLKEKGYMFLGIMAVAFLNFVLRMLMYFLADFERAYSLTDKAGSELWKLFLAQFVNTAILVLIVNANFYGAVNWGLAGFGTGQYGDTNVSWFLNVGSGLCITLLILVGANIIPTWLLEWVMSKFKLRWAKKCHTQEAMNQNLEKDDFLLSLRLAQTTNLFVCVIMYFSGMPFVLWVGVLYAICGYWFDKYYLLRCSKIPPQYSEGSIKICLKLMPIALIVNCAFMVWTFGNQVVFPSDPIDQAFYDSFATWDESTVISYMLGRSTFTNETVYTEYLSNRIVDSLRKAPFGGLLILTLTLGFIVIALLYLLFSKTIWALVQVCLIPCRRPASFVVDKTRGFFGMQVPTDEPPFREAKLEMIKQRVISSYKIQDNPRYVKAYSAISKLRIRSEKRSMKLKSVAPSMVWKEEEVPLSSPLPSPNRIGLKPGLGDFEVKVTSPAASRMQSPLPPREDDDDSDSGIYPTIDASVSQRGGSRAVLSPGGSRIGPRLGLGSPK